MKQMFSARHALAALVCLHASLVTANNALNVNTNTQNDVRATATLCSTEAANDSPENRPNRHHDMGLRLLLRHHVCHGMCVPLHPGRLRNEATLRPCLLLPIRWPVHGGLHRLFRHG